MAIKIIGVSCSPREKQSTRFAIETCLSKIQKEFPRVETELIDLAQLTINGCISCDQCKTDLTCSQEDDFQGLIPKLSDPNLSGLILATPVYFGTMSSQAKAFLDRCVVLRRNGALLRNVVGGVIAVGGFRHGGQETAIHAVHAAMLIQDMVIVGDGHSTFHFGGTLWSGHPDGYAQDAFGKETLYNLGKRVTETALKIKQQ
jgi:multimeric flavodoxin WrbA